VLGRLVPDIKKTAELVAEISAACREQDIGGDQINQAIQQLDKVTQQNASASEQMSATSEELAAQSEQLQASIAYFDIGTAASHTRHAVQAPAAGDDNLSAAPGLKRRLSRFPAAPPPKRPRADAKSSASRNTPPGNGYSRKQTGAGFALDLAHATADDRDADFVKY
jgi:methyl-accepting chemotaxis protein